MLVHNHPAARESPAPPLPLDLQAEAGKAHRVISGHYPLVLQAEDAVEVRAPAGYEGRALCRGRDAELVREARAYLGFLELDAWERKLDEVARSGSPDFDGLV